LQLENAILQEKETELHVEYQQLQDKSIALTSKIAELTSNLNEANKCLAAKQEDLTSYMSCLKVCVNSALTM
jgi:chromosome segregation ATPase